MVYVKGGAATHPEVRAHIDELVEAMRARFEAVPTEQLSAVKVRDVQELADSMLKLLWSPGREFGQKAGPVYSTSALQKLWGISRQAVSKKARRGDLLTLKVEGQNLFPAFQFDGKRVRQDVMEIVRVLTEAGVDEWSTVAWLRNTKGDDPKGRTMLELLDDGEHAVVENAARDTAHRLAH